LQFYDSFDRIVTSSSSFYSANKSLTQGQTGHVTAFQSIDSSSAADEIRR
jgi:hypothetical protein